MPPVIPYSQLTIPELIEIHNGLAIARGKPTLQSWHDSRCPLVQRIAILRTVKPLPPRPKPKVRRAVAAKKREQPIRDAMLEALAFVDHYEDRRTGRPVTKTAAALRPRRGIFSVGLKYADCVERVKRRFPHSKVSGGMLRFIAAMVRDRAPGFEACKLPQKRPHGTKGKRK